MAPPQESNLLDRLNRAVAQVLTRYSAMVMAATAPLPDTGNILEQAALNRMTMETESSALIAEVRSLLAINREIKALWITGALRSPEGHDSELEAELELQAQRVATLHDSVIHLRSQAISKEARLKAQAKELHKAQEEEKAQALAALAA
ncbi:uncharacterized protein GGS25DRAFT_130013 [Hypoxylon fragiforme]|uniref:uncharacterized protein n=1 Tax=Hypoxylon fragiforme TaxID=63214 RepID=UPI0020C6F18C|nr:uncharacterized protein GGS25DRAFT_130013 [Hypoxylon fragiforme]KAI2612670.1 hypothetical protein GGS25DRAFT_130013 [Hypoxylon fragiforme]